MSQYDDINKGLCARILSGDKTAEAELISFNDGLVHMQVNRIKEKHMLSHLYEYEDAVQDCRIALLEAVKTYEPEKGAFSTHAAWKMFGTVSRKWEEKYATHIPARLSTAKRAGTLKNVQRALVEAVENAVDIEDVMYCEEDSGDEVLYEDIVEDTDNRDPFLDVTDNDLSDTICKLITSSLTYKEQKVLVLRYGLAGYAPMTLEHIAKLLNVTRERVRQIEIKALHVLLNRCHKEHIKPCEIRSCSSTSKDVYNKILRGQCKDCLHYNPDTKKCTNKSELVQGNCVTWKLKGNYAARYCPYKCDYAEYYECAKCKECACKYTYVIISGYLAAPDYEYFKDVVEEHIPSDENIVIVSECFDFCNTYPIRFAEEKGYSFHSLPEEYITKKISPEKTNKMINEYVSHFPNRKGIILYSDKVPLRRYSIAHAEKYDINTEIVEIKETS